MNDNFNEQPTQDYVYALTVPARDVQNEIYFAARQSGLYASDDRGKTWRSAYDSLGLEAPLATTCLAISPGFAEDACLFAGVPGFVLCSEDGGKTWLPFALPYASSLPTALAISPAFAQDGTILVGTDEDGVLRSVDRGRTWSSWNFGMVDFNVLCLGISPNFAQDDTVYVGTSSGLFCSQTGGRSWKAIDLPGGYAPVLGLAVSPAFETDGTLLAGTETHGLFISDDRGRSWQHLGKEIIQGVVNQIILSPDYPAPPEILVVHDNTLLHSSDGGKTWGALFEGDIASAAAYRKPGGGLSVLVGLVNGQVAVL
jgi:photosystem II stability/assembly factor-like uncharacterized protein